MKNKQAKITIVYVEDDIFIAASMLKLFNRLFDKVAHFSNGKEAYRYISQHSHEIDLIITDITMPIMDGIKMIKLVRENIEKNIPTIALTAHGAEYLPELTRLDIKYLSKPAKFDILAKLIDEMLDPDKPRNEDFLRLLAVR